MFVVEHVLNLAAERIGMDPAEIRRKNYYGDAPRNVTHYGQVVRDNRLHRIHDELIEQSDYARRRRDIDEFNAKSRWKKRGIGFQPVKFGISFTNSVLNQAGALIHIYADGSVQVNHGGTEMGQGLHTKMIAVAAHELGVSTKRIRLMTTATDKVPNTSATAASSGSDLNGQAVRAACETLVARLRPVAAELLEVSDPSTIVFEDDRVQAPGGESTTFAKVANAAYFAQVSLSATGYYRTPDIEYDASKGRGKPFHYFAYGGAMTEVEINGLTGEHRVLRIDILHDVGQSLVPSIDRGQIEGGYIQGLGWLTCEELVWDEQGTLKTHSPDTYKIPALGEAPPDFRVQLLSKAPQDDVIHGSKAVGEPPFMLAISAVTALRHAVAAFSVVQAPASKPTLELGVPCTPESVLRAIEGVISRTTPKQAAGPDAQVAVRSDAPSTP
jgi:xanthine dehydrogenase large subunit